MRKVSKKLIMSVLTLVLTVIALGTTTFAWFSLSTISNVNNISAQVTAGDGLEVRLFWSDGTDDYATPWKSNLSTQDVKDFMDEIFLNKKLTAVTTLNTTGQFKKAGQTDLGNIWIDGADANANEDYIEFKVEFRSRATGNVTLTKLDITGDDAAVSIDGDEYVQIDGVAKSKHDVIANPANAARVSFDSKVFQLDGTKPVVNSTNQIEGNTFMTTNAIEAGQWDFLVTSKGLLFDKEQGDSDPVASAPNGVMIEAAKNNDQTELDLVTVALGVVDQDGYHSASFDVRIWIEGWDADTYDVIYNLNLMVSMTFKKSN